MFAFTTNYQKIKHLYPERIFSLHEVYVPGDGWKKVGLVLDRHNVENLKTVREQLEALKVLGYTSVSLKVKHKITDLGSIITDYKISELI